MGTDNSTTQITCDRCGCNIAPSDLQQGLAIRIANEVVCASCVDSLPSDTQLKINQIRAMRGMDSTTYRIQDPQRPQTQLYTFSTAANLIRHRHSLRTSGRYEAPLLPKNQRTVSHRSEVAKIAPTQSTPSQSTVRIYATLGSVVVLVLAATIAFWPKAAPSSDKPTVENQTTAQTSDAYETISQTVDPLQALDAAKNTYHLPADDPVVIELYKEIIQKKKRELDAAEAALNGGAIDRSKQLLTMTELPTDERRFVFLRDRQQNIQQRIHGIETPPPPSNDAQTETARIDPLAVTKPAELPPTQAQQEPSILVPETTNDVEQTPPETGLSDTAAQDQDESETQLDPSTLLAFHSRLSEMLWATPESGHKAWEHDVSGPDSYKLKLMSLSGALTREVELAAGTYRIWIKGHNRNPQASIQARFGEQHIQYRGEAHSSNRYKWFPLDDSITLTKSSVATLFLNFTTLDDHKTWYLRDILIADERIKHPDQLAVNQAQALAWQALPPPPPPKGPTHLQLTFSTKPGKGAAYQPLSQWGLTQKSLDTDIHASATLPYFVGPLLGKSLNAQRLNYRRLGITTIDDSDGTALVVPTPSDFDISQGKIKLLVYPSRPDRTELSIRFADHTGLRSPHPLSISVTPGKTWQSVEVTIPKEWQTAHGKAVEADDEPVFNPHKIAQVSIVDPVKRQTTPFYLAGISLISDSVDTQSGKLTKRSLIHANVPSLRTLRSRQIDPDKIRLLVPVHFNPDWHTKMRERMTDIIKPPKDRLPNGTITKMSMHNESLNKEFIKAYLDEDKVRHHVVMVVTAGIEFHTGQNRQQALRQFWLKMLDEARKSDFLPVVVLGPTKVNEEFVEETNALWEELENLIRTDKKLDDIPIIDLRSVGIIDYGQFASGGQRDSINLLGSGYEELRARILSAMQR